MFFILLAIALAMPLVTQAQELSPRTYWPSPEGTRITTISYTHVSGDITPNPTSPITGVDSSINTLHLGYRHTLSLWGRTANLTVDLPYSDGDTVTDIESNEKFRHVYNGIGDITTTLSVNLLGAPAMTKQQFGELRRNPRPILGVSLKVVAPTGAYGSDTTINIGTNRWAMKAELGYITSISPRWLLEVALGSWFFTDNNDFLGVTKEQKPIVAIEGHLVHRFKPGLWASLDMNYYTGGRSTVDGIELVDLQRNIKLGATIVYPFGGGHAIKLGYSHGSLADSVKTFQHFQISYLRLL
jgi:hypothetical protein